MQSLVLLYHDSPRLDAALVATLLRPDLHVNVAAQLDTLRRHLYTSRPALVVLDITAPDLGSFAALCREVRRATQAPVLVVCLDAGEKRQAICRNEGIVCLLVSPVAEAIIETQLEALRLRGGDQNNAHPVAGRQPSTLRFGEAITAEPLIIDLADEHVRIGERAVDLTPLEYRVLALLAQQAGQVVPYRQILQEVWGWDGGDHSYVHGYVSALRRKLCTPNACYFRNVSGVGYRFDPHPPGQP